MQQLFAWLPIIIQVISTVVIITLAFTSLKKDITVLGVLMGEKFNGMGDKFKTIDEKISEIKDNHLVHLAADIKEVENKLVDHLIQGDK